MAVTLTKDNVRIGGVKATFNSVQLGMIEGAEVTINEKTIQLTCDQWGEQVLDEIITAKEAIVKLGLKETHIDQLANVFGDWTVSGTGASKYCAFAANIGTSLLSLAKTLTLERLTSPTAEGAANDKLTFTKAVPVGDMVEKFSFTGYQVYEVTFKCFVDMTTGVIGYRGTPA